MEITRHFTATTIIVYKNKALLHLHKKLRVWLPVGGHIDRDELPQEAALREIKEETGLEVKLYSVDKKIDLDDAQQLIRPMHIILEDINQFHQHIDFIYYANANTFKLKPQDGQVSDLKWFTLNELKKSKMPANVKKLSLEALRILGK